MASVSGPFLLATGQFTIALDSDGSRRTACSSFVQPLVDDPRGLAALEELESAQERARQLNLDLPVGQRVEIFGATAAGIAGLSDGQVALTTAPCDASGMYRVRLEAEGQTAEARGRRDMATQYGLDDVLNMSEGQLVDLWDTFRLNRQDLRSKDQYVDVAMRFLEPVALPPLTVPAHCVQPLILDPAELFVLEARDGREPNAFSSGQAHPAPGSGASGRVRVSPRDDIGQVPRCSLCNDLINGQPMRMQDG